MKVCGALLLVGLAVVAALPETSDSEAWVKSGHFQGDIKVTLGQRNGITNSKQFWTNRIVPYIITGSFSSAQRAQIQATINWYNSNTCMRWVPRTHQTNYVNINNRARDKCWSFVGMQGGGQDLNLGTPGCIHHSVIAHEMMHAMGFWHQQSASDRDKYVTILWQNIAPGMQSNFDKYNSDQVQDFGVGYDYGSLMHYGARDFSANGRMTIQTKTRNAQVIGKAKGPSPKDILKLHRMYKCRA